MTFHIGNVLCKDSGETYRVTSIFQQSGTTIGRFSSRQTVDDALKHGDVVEDSGWPGYLWGVESMLGVELTRGKEQNETKVRLELLLPPPYVPWRNAPKVLHTDPWMLEKVNAMEVIARVTDRDDNPRAVQRRAKVYKRVCKEIGRLRRVVKTSKRPSARRKAEEKLRVLGEIFAEITI